MAGEPPIDVNHDAFDEPQSPHHANGGVKGHNAVLRVRRKSGNSAQGASSSDCTAAVAEATSKEPQSVPVDWEIPRKALHSSIGFLTLYLYHAEHDPHVVVYALGATLLVILPLDILRLRSSRFERLYERVVGFLMRESEKQATNGVIWYLIGAIFVLTVYPLDIAVVSIVILSWADTAASTFGRLWGRYTPPLPRTLPILRLPLAPRKSLAGFLAGSLTGGAIAAGFWGWFAPTVRAAELGPSSFPAEIRRWICLGIVGTVSGLVSGVAEALDLGSLDDNLTLPIISGGCIWGLFRLLELFITTS